MRMNDIVVSTFLSEMEKIASFATLAFGGVKGVTSKPARSLVKTVINPAVKERTRVGIRSGFNASPITKGTTIPPVNERTVRKVVRPGNTDIYGATALEGTAAMVPRKGPYKAPHPGGRAVARRGGSATGVSQTAKKPSFFRGFLKKRKAAADAKKQEASFLATQKLVRRHQNSPAQQAVLKQRLPTPAWAKDFHKVNSAFVAELEKIALSPELLDRAATTAAWKAESAINAGAYRVASRRSRQWDRFVQGALDRGPEPTVAVKARRIRFREKKHSYQGPNRTASARESRAFDVGPQGDALTPVKARPTKSKGGFGRKALVGTALVAAGAGAHHLLTRKKKGSTKTASLGKSLGTKQEGALPTFPDVKPIVPFKPKPVEDRPGFRPGPSAKVKMPGAGPFSGTRGPRPVSFNSSSGIVQASARLQAKYPRGPLAYKPSGQLSARSGTRPGMPSKPVPPQLSTGSKGSQLPRPAAHSLFGPPSRRVAKPGARFKKLQSG